MTSCTCIIIIHINRTRKHFVKHKLIVLYTYYRPKVYSIVPWAILYRYIMGTSSQILYVCAHIGFNMNVNPFRTQLSSCNIYKGAASTKAEFFNQTETTKPCTRSTYIYIIYSDSGARLNVFFLSLSPGR